MTHPLHFSHVQENDFFPWDHSWHGAGRRVSDFLREENVGSHIDFSPTSLSVPQNRMNFWRKCLGGMFLSLPDVTLFFVPANDKDQDRHTALLIGKKDKGRLAFSPNVLCAHSSYQSNVVTTRMADHAKVWLPTPPWVRTVAEAKQHPAHVFPWWLLPGMVDTHNRVLDDFFWHLLEIAIGGYYSFCPSPLVSHPQEFSFSFQTATLNGRPYMADQAFQLKLSHETQETKVLVQKISDRLDDVFEKNTFGLTSIDFAVYPHSRPFTTMHRASSQHLSAHKRLHLQHLWNTV
jgi:hypothetical protein